MHAKRAMLDTNVYEFLLEEGNIDKIHKLIRNGSLVIYGCKVVRDELRGIPKGQKIENKSLRVALLHLYDELVKNKSYPVGKEIEALAKEYLDEYKGGVSRRKIFSDFKIVATATVHRLDIIVSGDEKTMKSAVARRAYEKVNKEKMYPNPKFLKLEEL